jgi:ribosome maturation protein SDO1
LHAKHADHLREKDLDEVLQISNVFMNVSKGEVAKSNDLKKSFGTEDRNTIAREVSSILLLHNRELKFSFLLFFLLQILSKGEVQVGDKEREHDIAAVRREIATLVAEKCVDPTTQTPYSVSIIEKAMAEAGYSVRANKNAKSQVRLETRPCPSTDLHLVYDYTHT